MGRTYLRTLGECEKHGVVLEIRCAACQRVVYAAPSRLIGRRVGDRGKFSRETHLADIEPRLLCRGGNGQPGCTTRGGQIRPRWPHEVPGIPKGVPVIEWLNGDDRERKRLLRIARD